MRAVGGRVEDERGGVQDRRRRRRAASFVVALAEKSIAPFLVPAHRTGRDHFGHPALGRVSRAAFAGGVSRIPLGRSVQRPLERPECCGGCQAHANPPPLGSSERTPNQGPFPPLALPSFIGTMGPSDACRAHPPKGRIPGRPGRSTGLPCCQSPRAYVLRPLPRRAERSSGVGVSDRPRRPSSNERRLGARIQPFGACSGFTRVAARTLADPPTADLCPRGFDGSVALAVSRVATKVYRHLLGPDLHRLP
jgi:hypothetical protein